MYKTIIVPVDCGQLDKGERSLKKAKSLLDDGGQIVLVAVVEQIPTYLAVDIPHGIMESAIEDGKVKLAALRDKTGISAETELRIGSPAHEILATATERKADLIIIASHVPDFSNYLIGATADRVVRHAKCSVLVDR
ncbi:nucleotide-binding universal stress UspA family protein [Agrobacterium vitis]|nr:nucleotide-binding universal stress UspA family protein [Agrobacterium vitis]MBE1439249.1 nucleotide-binding universal stress UspA family protein [Agrobacterium vitis]